MLNAHASSSSAALEEDEVALTTCLYPETCLSRLFDHSHEDCMHPNALTYVDNQGDDDR